MSQTLVLLHGLNNTPAVWRQVKDCLETRAASFSVLAPELPVKDSVDSIAQSLLDQLPQRFSLAGFSFGGYVALAMLALAPERIERLALICSTSRADSAAAKLGREKSIEFAQSGGFERMMQKQLAFLVHEDRATDANLRQACIAMFEAYGPERFAMHMRAAAERPDRTDLLVTSNAPCLLVTAANDRVVAPEQVTALAQQLPQARCVIVDKSGHMLPLEQPAALSPILLEWLGLTID